MYNVYIEFDPFYNGPWSDGALRELEDFIEHMEYQAKIHEPIFASSGKDLMTSIRDHEYNFSSFKSASDFLREILQEGGERLKEANIKREEIEERE